LEKPTPTDTASRHAIGGRYGFTKQALRTMAISLFEDPEPDLPLTPTINYAMQQELQVLHLQADPLEVRYDCGSIRGYQRAQREVV
jgi:UTP-glucose-1-phosphate uridylyltransferase